MLKFSVQPERLELSVEAEAARVSGSGDLGAKSTGATRLERNLDDCGIIVCGVVVIHVVGFKTITGTGPPVGTGTGTGAGTGTFFLLQPTNPPIYLRSCWDRLYSC